MLKGFPEPLKRWSPELKRLVQEEHATMSERDFAWHKLPTAQEPFR